MDDRGAIEPRYKAFLSYSHKDAAAAARLHRRLETYRLPKRLAGTASVRGPVPERLWPIFRDRDELPAATDLSETVREALAQSGSVIVLCSPHSAASLWVAEEIEVFRKLHPDRPVLAVVLSGDPPDCFPKVMRAYGQDGTWHEPLATDLRRTGDGRQLGLLKLVAGITGVGLDALVQRDAQRKVRRVTAVTTAALIALLIMTAMAVIALNSRREAERQRAEAEGLVEFMLTDLRQGLKGVGRLDLMNNVNQRAMGYYESQGPLEYMRDDSLERRARVLGAMGEDDENSGNVDRARSRYEALYRTTEALLDKDPGNPARILAHARSENRLATLEFAQDNFREAGPGFRSARRLLVSIAAWGQARDEWLRLAAYVEGNIGATMLKLGEDAPVALIHCRRAVILNERLLALRPGDATVSYDLAFHYYWLAKAQQAAGQAHAAGRTQVHFLGLVGNLIADDSDNMLLREQQMELYVEHAEFLQDQGESEAAYSFLNKARALNRRLRERDPQNAVWADYQQRLSEPSARSQ